MYFPCVELLPFLRAVDAATTKNVNDANFRQDGSDILTTVVESLHGDPNIQSMFLAAAADKVPDLTTYHPQLVIMYSKSLYENCATLGYKNTWILLNTKVQQTKAMQL